MIDDDTKIKRETEERLRESNKNFDGQNELINIAQNIKNKLKKTTMMIKNNITQKVSFLFI